jgi:L-lactate dehydrogenase complex protein LldG
LACEKDGNEKGGTGVSDARTTILGRIDRAMRTARIPRVPTVPAPAPPVRPDASALGERFVLEARAVGVDVFVEASASAVRRRLAEVIGDRRVLSWSREHLPYEAGITVAVACLGSAPLLEQAEAGVGVTGCHAAIAETGSLVLLSGPGTSRTVSLLPPLHVALVRPEDLHFSMGGFFEAAAAQIARASCCTFVTGPSRTADIELSLTVGVHGPGRVVVIIGN